MKQALRYRLFKAGRMPATLAAAAPGARFSAEGISIKVRGVGVKLPGLRSGRTVSLKVGALVLEGDRMLASLGSYVLVDSVLTPGAGPYEVAFARDGVTLTVDLVALFPDGAGTASFHWDLELDPATLAALPSGPMSVDLPEQTAALVRSSLG